MDNPTNTELAMINNNPQTRQITLVSALTATCLGLQLLPRPPNIEFTSIITFTAGISFGCLVGAVLGAFVMLVNGFLSPWGLAGLNIPFQIVGMSIIGIVGGLYSKTVKGCGTTRLYVEASVLGAFLTLIYDVITNFGFAAQIVLFTNVSLLAAFIGALITGALFSFFHVASNFLLFMAAIPMARAIQEQLGR